MFRRSALHYMELAKAYTGRPNVVDGTGPAPRDEDLLTR